jgi:hypothetical protein
MSKVTRIIAAHEAHPDWTVPVLARHLELSHVYVRTVVVRKKLPVPKDMPGRRKLAA